MSMIMFTAYLCVSARSKRYTCSLHAFTFLLMCRFFLRSLFHFCSALSNTLTNVLWLLDTHLIIIVWSVKKKIVALIHTYTLSPFNTLIRTYKNLLNKSHSIIIMIIHSLIYNKTHYRDVQRQSRSHHHSDRLDSTIVAKYGQLLIIFIWLMRSLKTRSWIVLISTS